MSNTLTGKYKESGSSWIGMIPEMWGTCLIKNIFSIQKRIAGEEGHTVLSITQRGIVPKKMSEQGQFAQDYSHYQLVFPGDFAMNHMDLLTGWVDISKYEGVTSPDYRVFVNERPNIAYSDYFKYIFRYCYSNRIFYGLGQGVSGFGRWRLPSDMFLNFRLPLPPFAEQKAIAEFLGQKTAEIDTIIAEARASIEEYKSWKASIIYEAVTKGLDPNVEIKKTGSIWIKSIPAKWKITSLRRVSQMQTGGTVAKEENSPFYSTEGGLPWIKSDNLGMSDPIHRTSEYYTSEGSKLAKVFPSNTVYVCCIGSIGKIGFSDIECSCNQQINAVQFYENMYWKYGYYCLLSQENQHWYYANGNVMKILNSSNQGKIEIPFPPLDEQLLIANHLDSMLKQIEELVHEKEQLITDLDAYKKSLVYEVVTGKRMVT